MVDYKKIADIMQKYPIKRKWDTAVDFKNTVKNRSIVFKQIIDTQDNIIREVWGNKNFEIIVLHKGNEFLIL